jgi:hypothetical protein
MARNPSIKELRDFVLLSVLTQSSVANEYGIFETISTYTPVGNGYYAKLEPTKAHTSIGSAQTDMDTANATHTCLIRWLDNVDIFDTVTRQQRMPDGTTRTEYFRVLGTADNDGQLRFLKIDLQLVKTP